MQETRDNPARQGSGRCLVIVPAFNEAGSVGQVVEELRRDLPQADVLVVDDGSTDGTHEAVPEGARVLRLPFNLGIGGAMQAGYKYAFVYGYDLAMQVDGDGQHPAGEAHKLLTAIEQSGADMVIGSRFLNDEENYRPPAARAAGIGVVRTVLRLLTGQTITDCTSGFRVCNRQVIEAFAHWYPEDYPEPEVILLLQRAGYRVAETPVVMRERMAGRTSIPFLKGVFYILKVSTALVLDTVRRPWPQKAR